jgi:hypothetical protein
MKDSELRGILLQELYGQRHAGGSRFITLTIPPDIDENTAHNVVRQLKDGGLVEYMPVHQGLGPARISAGGVDVVEGKKPTPMAIQLHDHSARVSEVKKGEAKGLQIARSPLVMWVLRTFRLAPPGS